jgi:hypothetical protein
LRHLNAAFWKRNEWKLRKILLDFETENVLNGQKDCLLSNLLLLRHEISLCGDVLKGQRVMLIKWENFGAFLF